ncbi:hypothetical protein F511_26176 [Dorcoceras hygrometricum]|uniref:Calponin-homology (CH) domain-containing protein n=1 Tax=Dorcoceras hygrometricum TaxID=472368 RepID=A0A2Z7A3J4_9LAMI|nr:hypothetical protein F511_26176 [Dorcoceras hygrometricum]
MESRNRKPNADSSPLPNPPSTSVFKDLSNFRTPMNPTRILKFPSSPSSQQSHYFTASRKTPLCSSRRCLKTSALKSKAARKLKAFEVEQLKSARKVQMEKEKSLRTLSKSLTVWLNFLFKDPISCGCDTAKFTGEFDASVCGQIGVTKDSIENNGKREIGTSHEVGVGGPWRGPKRRRLLWKGGGTPEGEGISDPMLSGLRTSLLEICSFEDLKTRMRMYLNLASCKEIFVAMSHVTKIIDDGRLKMRANCPIVSDVGMKERAIKTLMCYNPEWLRIGLYIIWGGDSLLPSGDVSSDQEISFLRMVVEKQFFSHTGLARTYAYNKQVEGLYRPGYYEKLGNIILKRILLLAIIVDRAKSQTSLPLKYGIDGLDGGSPLLFSSKSNIKSSRQLITDFLSSDVMHGEGNLLSHLVIVGYKLSYQQNPLVEIDFKINDLFEDLRDGVRLCRAIELLKHDPSILMKMIVPSDTQKKSLVNCGVALEYLNQAVVPLLDEEGIEIIGEDIVNGDKELTVSLLWNMFVHLQLPLLINRKLLLEEIRNIQGFSMAICETYGLKVENQSSLLDGRAMWCLLDYYFRKQHGRSCSSKVDIDGTEREVSIMSEIEYTDAVHNFILSQKLTSLLGNFPEVLQVSDILEHNGACNGQSVIILLVFLSVQFLVKRNMDEINLHKLLGIQYQSSNETEWNNGQDGTKDFKAIMAWWQEMAQQNGKCNLKPAAFSMQSFLTGRKSVNKVRKVNAATIIQSHFRRFVARKNYLRVMEAALLLQTAALAWFCLKKNICVTELRTSNAQLSSSARRERLGKFGARISSMVDRNYFNLNKSVAVIQHAAGNWNTQSGCDENTCCEQSYSTILINAATVIQSHIRGCTVRSKFGLMVAQKGDSSILSKDIINSLHEKAAITIQDAWRKFLFFKINQIEQYSAIKIQSYYRGWLMRKYFASKKQGVITIQRSFWFFRCRRQFYARRKENASATILQSYARGWMARRKANEEKHLNIRMQQKKFLEDASRKIQSAFVCMQHRKAFLAQTNAAIDIQRFVRGAVCRKKLLGASCSYRSPSKHIVHGFELEMFLQSVKKVQRWWRGVLKTKLMTESAIVIQSHFRAWTAKQMAKREKQQVVVIQSYCRGWLQRKMLFQNAATRSIESAFHCMKLRKAFLTQKHAATEIQRFVRGENSRKRLLGASRRYLNTSRYIFHGLEFKIFLLSVVKLQRWWRVFLEAKRHTESAIVIQSHFRGWMAMKMAKTQKKHVIVIQVSKVIFLDDLVSVIAHGCSYKILVDMDQSYCHGWLLRKKLSILNDATKRIQSAFLCMRIRKTFMAQKHAAVDLQRFVRGENDRRRVLGAFGCDRNAPMNIFLPGLNFQILLQSIKMLQRCWRKLLRVKKEKNSAVTIQSHFRGWKAREMVKKEKQRVVVIQSYWKGYLVRKDAKGHLQDLRSRMQKTASNIDDSMRLINRLVAALSELLNMRSVSSILQICATLDVATKHSQRCCEVLVAAGAIGTILKLIRSVSRSIPDQEVLKHALSTLRNLAHYPHLTEILIESQGCVEVVFWEFLRNKEEGYFIASELLQRICRSEKGLKVMRNLRAYLKRLNNLAEEHARKARNDKGCLRHSVARERIEKRLKEAVMLLQLVKNS